MSSTEEDALLILSHFAPALLPLHLQMLFVGFIVSRPHIFPCPSAASLHLCCSYIQSSDWMDPVRQLAPVWSFHCCCWNRARASLCFQVFQVQQVLFFMKLLLERWRKDKCKTVQHIWEQLTSSNCWWLSCLPQERNRERQLPSVRQVFYLQSLVRSGLAVKEFVPVGSVWVLIRDAFWWDIGNGCNYRVVPH